MISRKIFVLFAAFLFLAGTARAGNSPTVGPGIEMRAGDFHMLSAHSFWPSCGCPDIAYTKAFQSEGLGYVASSEFTDAIRAVANGASEHSPGEVPADWRTAAENWIEYRERIFVEEGNMFSGTASFQLRDGDLFRFPKGKYACNPDLVRLASLEYMKKQGRHFLPPVSPRVVRAAIKELEANMAAKRQMAPRLAARAAAIASRIAEAERLGAGNCSPGGVSRTRMELEQAFLESRTARSALSEAVASFDRAERFADYLLSERRFASRRGGGCPE